MIKFFFVGLSLSLSALITLCIWGLSQIPSKEKIKGCFTTKMYEVELCPGGPQYVPLNQISKYVQKTLILAEDSTFYQHHGFDWESIEKNAKETLKTKKYKRGGSTISQQLAKNLFLTQEKTLARKAIEAVLTLKIEQSLSKNEILERYLNVVEFGDGIYGIKAAALFYFKKKPSELDVAESAFLVMLLPNPIKYSASFRKKELTKFAKNRLTQLIENLYQYQRIDISEYDIAMARVDTFFNQFTKMDLNQSPTSPAKAESESDSNQSEFEDDFL